MGVERTTISTNMALVADMTRYRTAATPTISSKVTCITRIRGTATITAPSRWLDEELTGSIWGALMAVTTCGGYAQIYAGEVRALAHLLVFEREDA
jgi:hypothetical protein